MADRPHRRTPDQLRSRLWFDNPDNPGMTALYLERYLNFGLTGKELQGKKTRSLQHGRGRPASCGRETSPVQLEEPIVSRKDGRYNILEARPVPLSFALAAGRKHSPTASSASTEDG